MSPAAGPPDPETAPPGAARPAVVGRSATVPLGRPPADGSSCALLGELDEVRALADDVAESIAPHAERRRTGLGGR